MNFRINLPIEALSLVNLQSNAAFSSSANLANVFALVYEE